MKKSVLSILAVALLSSCVNTNKKAETETKEVVSFEQQQIEAGIMLQIDSIASIYNQMDKVPFVAALNNGELLLTEEEKQVKPDYLIDPASVNDLVTLSQKYRAVAMLSIDEFVANGFDMDTEELSAAKARLVVDINDPAFDTFIKDDETEQTYSDIVTTFYQDELDNGRLNFFWETATASFVEQTYLLTRNPEKFAACFNDQQAADFTYRFILLQYGLEQLKEYAPELNELCTAIKPLEALNAITADQLKEQVVSLKDQIEEVRNGLLK